MINMNDTKLTFEDIHAFEVVFSLAIAEKKTDVIAKLLINNNFIDPNQWMDTNQFSLARPDCSLEPHVYNLLHISIINNHEALFDAILASKKSNLNKKTAKDETPLYLAVRLGYRDYVEKLLQFGADPTITSHGKRPESATDKTAIKKLFFTETMMHLWFMRPHTEPRFERGQFWLLGKMRALKESAEVMFGDDEGACYGLSNVSMLYLLINQRNAQGELIGQISLSAILKHLMSLTDKACIERIQYTQTELKRITSDEKQHLDNLPYQEIEAELLLMQQKQGADELFFNQAITITQKKSLLLQKKVEAHIERHFSDSERIDLDIPRFFDGIELCQNLPFHTELQDEKSAVTYQAAEAIFPLISFKALNDEGGGGMRCNASRRVLF